MSLLPVFLILLAITLPHLDTQPIWDGSVILSRLNLILRAPSFNLLDYREANHISIAYYLFLRGSFFFWKNVISCYLANIVLLMASMTAFYGIAKMLTREASDMEAAFMTAAFGFAPLYVAHIFNVTLDFGLVSFLTIYLYFLLRERYRCASIFAVAACFTKEPGIPIYLGTLALKVGMDYFHARGTPHEKVRHALEGKWILILLPTLLLALYFAFLSAAGERLIWLRPADENLFQAIDFNIFDASMRAYLANIFILNFNWIPTVLVLSLVIAILCRGKRIAKGIRWDLLLFLLGSLCLTVYVTTCLRPFNNARYILPTTPVLFALAFAALTVLVRQRVMRIAILSVMVILAIASNFRTIDPVSRWVFGTFDFGGHKMLDVASFFGNSRRDELVYNLEYTNLQYLANSAAEHLFIDRDSIIFIGGKDDSLWPFAVPARDSRDMPFTNRFPVRFLADQQLMTPEKMREYGNPSVFYFFAFPNNENGPNLNYLKDHYPLLGEQEFDYKGYRMKVYAFRNAPV